MTTDLRALVEKWRASVNTVEMPGEMADGISGCADELQAALDAQAGLVCVGWQWNDARDKLGWLELHLPPHKNPRPEPHMKYRRIYAGPVEGGEG